MEVSSRFGQDFYASVALLVGTPLQLCFQSALEAESFAREVQSRAAMKRLGLWKLKMDENRVFGAVLGQNRWVSSWFRAGFGPFMAGTAWL